MLTALLGLLAVAAPLGAMDARALAASARDHDAPGIRVWVSSRDLFHRGDRARVYYRTERDAFVTVLRVDTDGRVEVLFPRSPDDDNYAYGGTTYSVNRVGRNEAFVVDDDPGVGYLFAVASDEPFDYHALLDGERWDVRLASGGRVHGDPLQALEEMVVQTLPPDYTDFDTHLIPYYVEQRYEYPRFVCYDCHAYTPYTYWDPYTSWCPRYTLVVWHDPFYYYPSYWYPTWYYGGTRVVYVNPGGSNPDRGRYVFKDRGNSEPGITYRDRRAGGQTPDRRSGERFVRGTDVGGVGSVPVPGRRTTEPTRRQVVDVPSGGEGLAPRGTMDGRRRTPERQDAGAVPADERRGTGLVPTQPTLTPEAPAERRNAVLWQSPDSWRQQPSATERRSSDAQGTRAEPQGGRRGEAAPQQSSESERRAAPGGGKVGSTQAAPPSRGGSQPSARGDARPDRGGSQPSARGGSQPDRGGSQPSARGSSQPSSRGSSGSSARPSGGSSGGSRPASPGLVRRRP